MDPDIESDGNSRGPGEAARRETAVARTAWTSGGPFSPPGLCSGASHDSMKNGAVNDYGKRQLNVFQ
jgi:hypothetical protein